MSSTGRASLRTSVLLMVGTLLAAAPNRHLKDEKGVRSVVGIDGTVVGEYGESYALLIGVSKYSRGWNRLERVPGELQLVKAQLIAEGFKEANIEIKMDPDHEQLRDWVDKFVEHRGWEKDNRLFVMFSGHGDTLDDEGLLVPSDAPTKSEDAKGLWASAMPISDFVQISNRIQSKHALFVFDSCFSGTVFQSKSGPVPAKLVQKIQKRARQFITAGSANETVPAASELVPVLVSALKYGSADTDRDGYTTGDELGLYIAQNVKSTNPQYGRHAAARYSEGDFLFFTGSANQAGFSTSGPAEFVSGHHEPTSVAIVAESAALCERSIAEGCHNYAWLFEHGRYVKEDIEYAIDRYEKACDLGSYQSCSRLVAAYEDGTTGERHAQLARSRYERTCTADTIESGPDWQYACRQLGLMYLVGRSLERDEERALSLLTRTFPDGAKVWQWIGATFRDGHGVPANRQSAESFLRRGCDAGAVGACIDLARLYLVSPETTTKEEAGRAIDLLLASCDKKAGEACFDLAQLYLAGRGPIADISRARLYLERACDNGYSRGCRGPTSKQGDTFRYDASYALVVAIDDYRSWPRLPGARRDAAVVEAALRKHGFETHTFFNPSRAELSEALSQLPMRVGPERDSRLVVYYAGHGYSAAGLAGEPLGFLVPADAPTPDDGRDFGALVSLEDLQVVSRSTTVRHVLFLLDTVVNHAPFKQVRGGPVDSYLDLLWGFPARLLLTAGAAGEKVPDESRFAKAFANAIDGAADFDKDGVVTGGELSAFVSREGSTAGSHPSYTRLEYKDYGLGDIFFFVQ